MSPIEPAGIDATLSTRINRRTPLFVGGVLYRLMTQKELMTIVRLLLLMQSKSARYAAAQIKFDRNASSFSIPLYALPALP